MKNLYKAYQDRKLTLGLFYSVIVIVLLVFSGACSVNKYDLIAQGLDLYDKGLYDAAFDVCTKVIEVDVRFESGYACRGNIYYNNGQYKKAIVEYERALALTSRSTGWKGVKNSLADAYYNVGSTYFDEKQYTIAFLTLKKSISLNPQNSLPYNKLGIIYHSRGDFADAIFSFKKSTELDPEDDQAFYYIGEVYSDKKEQISARKYFRIAAELGHEDAVKKLAKSAEKEFLDCEKHGRETKVAALATLQKIEDFLEPAKSFMNTRKYNEAERLYLKVIEIAPGVPDSRYRLAMLKAEKEEYKEAMLQMRCFMTLSKDIDDINEAGEKISEWNDM